MRIRTATPDDAEAIAAVHGVLDSSERARRFYALAGFSPDGATKVDTMSGVAVSEVRYRREL